MKRRLIHLSMFPLLQTNIFLCYAPHWALQLDFQTPVLKWVVEVDQVEGKTLMEKLYFIATEGEPRLLQLNKWSERSQASILVNHCGLTRIVSTSIPFNYTLKPFWNNIKWPAKIDCVFPNTVSAELRKGLAPLIEANYAEQTNAGTDQTAGARIEYSR